MIEKRKITVILAFIAVAIVMVGMIDIGVFLKDKQTDKNTQTVGDASEIYGSQAGSSIEDENADSTEGETQGGITDETESLSGTENDSVDETDEEETTSEENENTHVSIYDSVEVFYDYAKQLGKGLIIESGKEVGSVSVGNNTTIFIGDSFFDRRHFWTDFYSSDYVGKDVFLAGISSTRSNHWQVLKDDVFSVFEDTAPKNIVIHLGTNDIHDGWYSVEKTSNGLRELFTMLHETYPKTKIYYFGITYPAFNTFEYEVTKVNRIISEWCADKEYIIYIDTPSIITEEMLRGDGVHPKLETYSIFMRELEKAGCIIEEK